MCHSAGRAWPGIVLSLLLSAECATATRAQEPLMLAEWGRAVDPVGDCRLSVGGKRLSIRVPGAYRDLVAMTTLKDAQAPRVVRQAEGDFTLSVIARKFETPEPKTSANKANPTSYVSSGLLIWQDEDTFLRLQRAANGDTSTGPAPFIHANQFAGGKMIGNVIVRVPMIGDAHLRIERRGGKFQLAYGTDGREWTAVEMKGTQQPLRDPVQIGVFVINATKREIEHEFTDLRLTK